MARARRAETAPAHRLRIPSTAEIQLSTGLAWVAEASRGRLSDQIVESALQHYRVLRTEPGILIAAAVQYLVSGSDREDDPLNRYWHIVNQVSARERARYLNLEEKELL